jgi:nicotinate-nucleotide pyrophosphorylase (carboxylating)
MQKYAVRCGGGVNHRRDLSSAVLVKENHLAFFQGAAGRALFGRRVAAAHRRGLAVQVECRNRGEARWALEAGADLLLLDNISLRSLRGLVGWIREESRRLGRVAPGLEVSGGVTLATVGAIARAGVDRISIGRLTHSAPGLDMNMDVVSA